MSVRDGSAHTVRYPAVLEHSLKDLKVRAGDCADALLTVVIRNGRIQVVVVSGTANNGPLGDEKGMRLSFGGPSCRVDLSVGDGR